MDDATKALAHLTNEVQRLRERNAELEAAAVAHQRIAEDLQMSERASGCRSSSFRSAPRFCLPMA